MKKAAWDIDDVLQRHGSLLIKLWLQAAKRSGLSKNESRVILREATKNNYLYLVNTLQKYSESPTKILGNSVERLVDESYCTSKTIRAYPQSAKVSVLSGKA